MDLVCVGWCHALCWQRVGGRAQLGLGDLNKVNIIETATVRY